MNPYHRFVSEFARLAREGPGCPLGGIAPPPHAPPRPDAPKGLLFSPHPDDESITGGLALRLLRECGWNVINVAVTLGSKPQRRAARLEELRGACRFLGFELVPAPPGGLENIAGSTGAGRPKWRSSALAIVAGLLRLHQPKAIFFPHELDWNRTHIATHWLVMGALPQADGLSCYLVETEFWGQMASPNLLVEYSVPDVADLVTAVSFHAGEVRRNPYHLRLPAWLHDNVRRGAELVGGQGQAAPDFVFGQLFRLRRWRAGRIEPCFAGGRNLAVSTRADTIFAP
jgi:LmbE family N-acetylglucosaminyl deacetylase